MNLYSLPPLISALFFLTLGIYVFLKKRAVPNLNFTFQCLTTFWWQFSWFVLFNIKSSEIASVLVKIGYSGIIFIPPTFFNFYVSFFKDRKLRRWANFYFSVGVIFLIILWGTKFFISGFYKYSWGYYPKANFVHLVFLTYLTVIALQCFYILLKQGFLIKWKGSEGNQIKYLAWSLFFYTFASSDFLVNWGLEFYPLGFIFITFSSGIVTYAIAKEHLFDIDLATHYIFTWVCSITTAAGIFLAAYFLTKVFPIGIFLQVSLLTFCSVLAAAFFPKYFEKYENWSNDKILHHAYDFIKLMPDRARDWTKYLNLEELLKVVTKDFIEVMKVKQIKILLTGDWVFGSHDAAKCFYQVGPGKLSEKDNFKLPKDHELLRYAGFQEGVIYLEDLKKDLANANLPKTVKDKIQLVVDEMNQLEVILALAVMYEDKYLSYLIGLICLGGLSEKMIDFMKERIAKKFLSQVAAETGAAFQHSLKSRKMEIVDEKKGHFLDETLRQVRSLQKEKEVIEKGFGEAKNKSSRLGNLASKFATKIQFLAEAQEDFDALLRFSRSGVVIIREGQIKSANIQARHFLIKPGEIIINEPYEKIFTDQFKNTGLIKEDIKKVFETGQVSRTFETDWTKGEQPFPVEIKIIPLKDRLEIGRVTGVLLEITDISEVKERQRLLHLTDKFETFREVVQGFNHEIRNPLNILNAMVYSVDKMKEKVLGDESFLQEFINSVPRAIKNIDDLLKNLTDIQIPQRLEGVKPVDINKIIQDVLCDFAEKINQAKVTLKKDLGSLPLIVANPEHLKTVFYEVIKNAIEAIEDYDQERELGQEARIGGTIFIVSRENEFKEVTVKVSDTGIGIDESRVDKVVNPFHTDKVHSVTHSQTGTGLGLSKVFNILQAFGGTLKIESKLREGTTVTITFKKEITV